MEFQMKIRQGFVSNSSSSSFIVIVDAEITPTRELLGQTVYPGEIGETEFGWQKCEYHDMWSKMNFAYLQALYKGRYTEDNTWAEMLDKVVKEHLGADVIWAISDDFESDVVAYGYIDHESACPTNCEMFDSEEKLKSFLFNENSYIHNQNDNE
jgi:hypothetical protein